MATFDAGRERERSAVVMELGLRTEARGDGLHGTATATPEMWVPGTEVVRTSVLAVWADSVTGMLAGLTTQPRITVTIDLDLHLRRLPRGEGEVAIAASVVKAGRTINVTEVALTWGEEAEPFAVGNASFMASPNPDHVLEGGFPLSLPGSVGRRLPEPLAERAGARRIGPGVAEVPWRMGNLNATDAIQGGLVALAAEEAALSAAPAGTVATSLVLRYLRPFRSGALARAELRDGVATVALESNGRAAASATLLLGPAAR